MTYYLHRVGTYVFHVKIQLFVTKKYEQDPDPHWFGSMDTDPDLYPH
jgi:hypothetical protein